MMTPAANEPTSRKAALATNPRRLSRIGRSKSAAVTVRRRSSDLARLSSSSSPRDSRASRERADSAALPTMQEMLMRKGNLQHTKLKHTHIQLQLFDVARRLLISSPPVVLSLGLLLYTGVAVAFAALFTLAGANCYDGLIGEFGFVPMLWLSVHTASTIGFGSPVVSDECTFPQLLVLLESYVALIVSSAIGGYVFTAFIRTRPRIRFSEAILVTKRADERPQQRRADERPPASGARKRAAAAKQHGQGKSTPLGWRRDSSPGQEQRGRRGSPTRPQQGGSCTTNSSPGTGSPDTSPGFRRPSTSSDDASETEYVDSLNFRVVACERGTLRDVHVRMQATVWIALGSDSAVSDRAIASRKSSLTANKGAIVTLQLEQDYFTRLEQIQLSHRIDTSSPLYRARKALSLHVDSIDVCITAFDEKTQQEIRLFKHYEKTDIVQAAEFEVMFGLSDGGALLCDHSKLDRYTKQSLDSLQA